MPQCTDLGLWPCSRTAAPAISSQAGQTRGPHSGLAPIPGEFVLLKTHSVRLFSSPSFFSLNPSSSSPFHQASTCSIELVALLSILLSILLPPHPHTSAKWPRELSPRPCVALLPANWSLPSSSALPTPSPAALSAPLSLLPVPLFPSSRSVVSRPWTLPATRRMSMVRIRRLQSVAVFRG